MKKLGLKIMVFALSVIIVLSFTACKKPDSDKTTLKVYSWWDITTNAALQGLEKGFEDENKDINLEFVSIPTGYATAMLAMVAADGEMPDVIMLAMDRVPQYAEANVLLNMDSYLTNAYKNDLYDVVLNACRYNGHMYSAARDVSPMCMFLNTKMFSDAGVALPDENWTINDFVQKAKALTKGEGAASQWGYYMPKNPDPIFTWVNVFGGKFYNADGTSAVTSAETIAGVKFEYDLIHTHGVMPSDTDALTFGKGTFDAFKANKVAMQVGALSTYSDFDSAGTQYTVLPLPKLNATSGYKTHAFVNTWAIPKKAANPDLSWRVVEYLSGSKGQQLALELGMGLPASKSVNTTQFLNAKPYNKYFVNSLSYAVPYPCHQYGAAFQTAFKQALIDGLWDVPNVDVAALLTNLEDTQLDRILSTGK